jgi:hypothetical protein
MSEKVYPKGLRTFPPREGAPDFVKGTLIITPRDLVEFIKERPGLLTEYNGAKQLKCNILEGDKGLYFVVDTWKPDPNQRPEPQPEADGNNEPLPF